MVDPMVAGPYPSETTQNNSLLNQSYSVITNIHEPLYRTILTFNINHYIEQININKVIY